MPTKIYKDYAEFENRPQSEVDYNGVSFNFTKDNHNCEEMNETNISCWECINCEQCLDCEKCENCIECENCILCTDSSYCYYLTGCEDATDCNAMSEE